MYKQGDLSKFNLMRFYPCLTTTREDIDSFIECIKEVIM